jgi:hypothetical protein
MSRIYWELDVTKKNKVFAPQITAINFNDW